MTHPVTLRGVEQAVESALRLLKDGPTTVALTGPTGTGKSAALRAIHERKTVEGFKHIVLVAPPDAVTNPDAGLVGLVDLAAQLDHDRLLTEVKRIDITWKGKLDHVMRVLTQRAQSTLLLFDQPFLPQGGEYISTIFTDHAADLSRTLLNTPGLNRIVATNQGALLQAREIAVSPSSNPTEVLAAEAWGLLADSARAVLRAGGQALETFSPLDLRLRVGLLAVGADASTQVTQQFAPHKLVRTIFEKLGEMSLPLKKVLGRLAVFRTPIDEEALQDTGVVQLNDLSQSLVTRVLLFGPPDRRRLHEAIAREAIQSQWLTPSEERKAHDIAARYHHARFEHATRKYHVREAVRHELEEVHHLTQAGDARKLLSRSIFFVEQYDALGKALSQQRNHLGAIPAYERALAHDSSDAYAHHYLAYNLDVLAEQPQRVEQEFREAIRWRKDHVWYRSRLINFLLTRGRVLEAHSEWEQALAALLPNGPSTDVRLYKELHGEIARLLLHRGRLDFAAEVLEDVPQALREGLSWHLSLTRLHGRLLAAARDEEVFPPHLSEQALQHGPFLLNFESDRQKLESWMSGRIAAIDEEEVHIRVARSSPESPGIEFFWLDLSHHDYWTLARHLRGKELLPSGTFVEIIKLRGEQEFLMSFPGASFEDPNLPMLFPHPDRYLHRGPTRS